MLADERDTIEEELQREEEPHERVIIAIAVIVYCRERMHWGASLAVTNLRFHVDLVCGEKSLRYFIFSNPCK